MIRNLLLCTAALALTAAPALAKEAPPAPAAPKPFALPPLTEFTLANGMKVTMAQHGNVPKVTIVASVRTGNIDDGQNVWLADLTGALMQKGAGAATPRSWPKRLPGWAVRWRCPPGSIPVRR
ncbi:hypothetical protein ACFSLT_03590 [Novosphingobium resinovorum]